MDSMGYRVRPGTVEHGKEYEIKLAALLSLRCISQENEDMWLALNVEECGAFDDIVLYCKTKNQKCAAYFIQSKHQDSAKRITENQFLVDKGDFSLKKYSESLRLLHNAFNNKPFQRSKVLNSLRQNSNLEMLFIIFTNRWVPDSKFLTKAPDLEDFNTINVAGNVYKFNCSAFGLAGDDMENLFKNFYLFTDQVHIKHIDEEIEKAIKNVIQPLKLSKQKLSALTKKFVDFIANWSKGSLGGHYTMTKKQILKVLSAFLLEPYVFEIEESQDDEITNGITVWNTLLNKDIVVINNVDEIVEHFLNTWVTSTSKVYRNSCKAKKLWLENPEVVSKDMLRCVNRSDEISLEEAYEVLWKSCKTPLLLEIHCDKDAEILLNVLKLFPGVFRVVILNRSETFLKLNTKSSLCALSDLKYAMQRSILNWPVKLQGRSFVKSLDIIDLKTSRFVSTKDIIYILFDKFNIGEELRQLPNFFIERSLFKIILKAEVLQSVTDEVFIIRCASVSNFHNYLEDNKLNFDDLQVCLYENEKAKVSFAKIILLQNESNQSDVEKHPLLSATVHHLVLNQHVCLEWIKSKGTIENIKPFQIIPELSRKSTSEHLEKGFPSHAMSLKDSNSKYFLRKLPELQDQNLIIISGVAGLGKSVLMDYISVTASTDVWVLRINLIEHTDFLERENSFLTASEILLHLKNKICGDGTELVKSVFQKYVDSGKVLTLWDGFDEISANYQNKVVEIIQCLHEGNFSMWITTRPFTQVSLEETFGTFAFTLSPFTKNCQKRFLTNYFSQQKSFASATAVDKILDVVSQNIDNQFSSVPLHILLLAEVFADNFDKIFDSFYFNLFNLYKKFIDKKIEIACAKYGINLKFNLLQNYRKYQSFYALKLLFSKGDLTELQLDSQLQNMEKVFPYLLQEIQRDGVVVIDRLNRVTFIHRTYAEYLAAEWLAENISGEFATTIKKLVDKMFNPQYDLLRHFFDCILCSDNALHFLIVNKRIGEAKQIARGYPEVLTTVDKANRSFLHVFAMWGTYDDEYKGDLINDVKQFFKVVPQDKIVMVKDVLGYTPIDYAIKTHSYDMGSIILENSVDVNACTVTVDKSVLHDFITWSLASPAAKSLNVVLIKRYIEMDIQQAQALNEENTGTESLSTIQKLLRKNKKIIDEKGTLGMALLHWAAIRNRLDIASLLLSLGADKNAVDDKGMTALHYATIFNYTEAVKLLLGNSASCDIEDNFNNTIREYAAFHEHFHILELLITHGNDLNYKNKNGMTVLHFAALCGRINIIKFYLLNKAEVNVHDKWIGKTPLQCAALYGYKEIMELLLNHGANINATDFNGKTPLFSAVHFKQLDVIKTLLSKNASIEARTSDGVTALNHAVDRGYVEVAEVLLNHGANPDSRVAQGLNALHIASMDGHANIVKLLLSRGCAINSQCLQDKEVLHEAVTAALFNLGRLRFLEKAKTVNGFTALHFAALEGYLEVAKLLLSEGCDIEAKDSIGRTAVHVAVDKEHLDIVELLLSGGADAEGQTSMGFTPLHIAAIEGHMNVAKLLLSKGCSIDAKSFRGFTPLHIATLRCNMGMVQLFVTNGANRKARNDDGRTALHWAAIYGCTDVACYLLTRREDVNVRDGSGKTALNLAFENGNKGTLDALIIKASSLQAHGNRSSHTDVT